MAGSTTVEHWVLANRSSVQFSGVASRHCTVEPASWEGERGVLGGCSPRLRRRATRPPPGESGAPCSNGEPKGLPLLPQTRLAGRTGGLGSGREQEPSTLPLPHSAPPPLPLPPRQI